MELSLSLAVRSLISGRLPLEKPDFMCNTIRYWANASVCSRVLVFVHGQVGAPGNWDHIVNQIGMFSYTGLTKVNGL